MTKAIINREEFLPAIAAADSIIEARNTIPILSHARLVFGEKSVSVTGTDLDMELHTSADCNNVETSFECAAPAKRLHEVIKRFSKNQDISISSDGQQISLSSGKSLVNLPILLAADFPDLPQDDNYTNVSVKAAALEQLFKLCQFAISTEETRYYLNGIYFHLSEHEGQSCLTAVATDGHRLAKVVLNTPIEGLISMPAVIIPRKTVLTILKALPAIAKKGDDIEISLSDKKIRFELDGNMITSKLIDGNYPDYERVIPKDNCKIWTLETSETLAAIDRVSCVSTVKGRAIKMGFSAGKLTMSINSPDEGSAEDEVKAVEQSKVDPVVMGFNGAYFANLLSQLTETFNIELEDPGSPAVFRNLGDEGEDITSVFVLMPMRA